MTGYEFHPEARLDLEEIWVYIGADSLDAAERTVEEILSAVRSAVSFPELGHHRPDLTARPVRFLLVRDYLICYAPRERPLSVLAILHGRRSPRVLAALLKGRE